MPDRSVLVRLTANNSQFDAAMKASADRVSNVGHQARLSGDLTTLAFYRMKAAAIGFVSGAVLGAGQSLINLQQSAQVAFTSMMGDAQKASAMIGQIYQWDQTIPVPFQNALAGAQKLMAYGVQAQDLIPTLQAVADATGAAGNPQAFDNILLAIGQIQSKGRVMAQEMLQLTEAGIPAWDILAKEIGVTVPQAMKMAENGTIDATTALTAFRDGIEKRFPEAAQKLKDTTAGAWQSFLAGIRDGSKSILDPLQAVAKQALQTGHDIAQIAGSGVGSTIQGLTSTIGALLSPLRALSGEAEQGKAFMQQYGPTLTAAGLAMLATSHYSTQLASGWETLQIRGLLALDSLKSMGATVASIPGKFTTLSGAAAAGRAALTGIGTAARSAASGLMAAFGGPLGLAIIGATVAMSLWGQAQQSAAKREAEHEAQLAALKDTLDKVTGALTAATTAKIAKDWVDDGTVTKMKQLGINTDLAVQAATKGGPALDALRAQVASLFVEQEKQQGWYKEMVAAGKEAEAQATAVRIANEAVLNPRNAQGQIAYIDDGLKPLMEALTAVTDVQVSATKGGGQLREAFELVARAAANTAGVSADRLIPALDAAKASGGSVEQALKAAGFTADETGKIVSGLGDYVQQGAGSFHVMAGGAVAASTALQQVGMSAKDAAAAVKVATDAMDSLNQKANAVIANVVQGALALRQSIAQSAVGFVDPLGAWTNASDLVNRKPAGGGSTSVSNNLAVKAAAAAVKAGQARADSTKKSAKAEQDAAVKAATAIRDAIVARSKADVQATKDAQSDAQKRVDAAKKEADALKQISDDQAKGQQDAEAALSSAQFRQRAADIALDAARRGLAGARTPAEQASWQAAYNQALRSQQQATTDLASAQADYASKTAQAAASQQASAAATASQTSAEDALSKAKDNAATVAEDASTRQQAATQALSDARDKADARYQKAVDASTAMLQALKDAQDAARTSAQNMADGASSAVAGMAAKVKPSFQQWMDQLSQQKKAQEDWADNLRGLARKLPADVTEYLAGLGPGAADMIAQMNQQSAAQLGAAVPLLRAAMPEWSAAITDSILGVIPDSKAAMGQLGDDTMQRLIKALQDSKEPTRDVLAQFGLQLSLDAAGHPIIFPIHADPSAANAEIATWLSVANATASRFAGGISAGPMRFYAGGGNVADGWFWSGERGPELGYKSGSDVTMYPAGQSAVMAQPAPEQSGPRVVINQYTTAYYPQVEPASVATNRNLADAATLVSLG